MENPQQEELLDTPSALDLLVSELSHTSKSQYIGLVFPVPTRLQPQLFGYVEALTHRAGTSRNKLMNQLVEVGVNATLQALPNNVRQQIEDSAAHAVQIAVEKNAGLLERGEI